MSSQYNVQSMSILIMGGTTGLGLSAAEKLVSDGAQVVVVSRSAEHVEDALKKLGEGARGLVGDAAQADTSDRAVALAVESFGRLDALYHVAGGSGRSSGDGALHDLTDAGWRYTVDLNLSSVVFSNRAAVRQFRQQGGGGCILNMSSVLGWSPSPRYFASHAYAASKAAVIGFSESIASYYAAEGIRVNVIAPALFETPMSARAVGNAEIMRFVASKQPLDGGRVGLPSDADGAACFLLSRDAGFITGQVIAVDGGWCVSEGQYGDHS